MIHIVEIYFISPPAFFKSVKPAHITNEAKGNFKIIDIVGTANFNKMSGAYNWCIYYNDSTEGNFYELCVIVILDLCETSVITIKRQEKIIKVRFDVPYTKETVLKKIFVNYRYYLSINIEVDAEEEDKIDAEEEEVIC